MTGCYVWAMDRISRMGTVRVIVEIMVSLGSASRVRYRLGPVLAKFLTAFSRAVE